MDPEHHSGQMAITVIQMQYFCTVMRMGSLTRAAELLCVTPEAASAQIKKLERNLGCQLAIRLHGHWKPTPEGYRLMAKAEGVLADIQAIQESVVGRENPRRLKVLTIRAVGSLWMPQWIHRLTAQAGWAIDVRTGLSRDILPSLESEVADIGVVSLFDDEWESVTATSRDALLFRRIVHEEVVAVFSSSQAVGRELGSFEDRISYAELTQFGPIIFLEDMPLRPIIEKFIRSQGLKYKRQITSNDIHVILGLISQGVGVGLLPEIVTQIGPDDLAFRRLDHPVHRGIYAVTRKKDRDRWATLVDELCEAAEKIFPNVPGE